MVERCCEVAVGYTSLMAASEEPRGRAERGQPAVGQRGAAGLQDVAGRVRDGQRHQPAGADAGVIKGRHLVERARKQLYSHVCLSAFGLNSARNGCKVQGCIGPKHSADRRQSPSMIGCSERFSLAIGR